MGRKTDLNTARGNLQEVQDFTSAGLAFGGQIPGPHQGATEEWSGSSNTTKTIDTD